MDKNFNEFFEELNDMANFKNFGEKVETEENEIIIDDVNVAGCDYYDAGRCQCLLDCTDNKDLCMRQINIDEDLCKDNLNCYYKQVKRLETENAELKGTIEAYQMSENEANEIIAEQKAENERLEEEIKRYKNV